ncbi:hypothetical protein P879_11029 [Paragonimus westermani]|uniref:BTB domain-containing protein n=1 Tax=Paragonimus westermani TaxID=34504 RepID=A0A8T0D1Q0_9TREM|nr:hypothetical protein P879_11029 [Paragonimus westermani]
MEELRKDLRRLQSRVSELQNENSVLRATLGKESTSFCSRLMEFVKQLHLSDQFSDIKLKTPERLFPGHKFVLSARGGLWSFDSGGEFETVEITGFTQSVCEALIAWVYKGEINRSEDATFLCEFINLAKLHELTDLVLQCEFLLGMLLTRSTCTQIYEAAFTAKANCLLERSFSILSEAWSTISTEELDKLSPQVLCSILEKQSSFPLHDAIKLDRTDVAVLLLEANPVELRMLVNLLDQPGLSPLYLALQRDNFTLAEQLIRCGADPNLLIGPSVNKQPTGHFALLNNHFTAVRFLVDHGYEVDSCLKDSQATLLHLLVANGSNNAHESAQLDLARAILDKSISVSAPDGNGRTPLHIALLHNSKAMFDLLLEQPERFDLDAADRLGCPPLWFALVADFGDTSTPSSHAYGFADQMFSDDPPLSRSYAASLIRAGADVNFRFGSTLNGDDNHTIEAAGYSFPKDGDTLLMACARCGLESGALFLLQPQPNCSAAAVESTNVSGETVYHLAVESKLRTLSHCLATVHRADPNQFRIRTVTTNEPNFTKVSLNSLFLQLIATSCYELKPL